MRKVVSRDFFNRDTQTVAKDLLGKYLVRRLGRETLAGMITEAEAYDGFFDKASHAHKGKTQRTRVMFGHPGVWYVYLCYGMYQMLNVVTREKEYPAAVLIRGLVTGAGRRLDGPGKITKFLSIGKLFNEKTVSLKTGLWVEDRGVVIPPSQIMKTARVGVAYAGPRWAGRKLRFLIR